MTPAESRTRFEAQAHVLEAELAWLAATVDARLKAYFGEPGGSTDAIPPPPIDAGVSGYASVVSKHELGDSDRLILILALAPHLTPQMLDVFFVKNATFDRRFTEFGGIVGQAHAGFLPTVETALFILAAGDRRERLYQMLRLTSEHVLVRSGILALVQPPAQEPATAAALQVTAEGLHQVLHGE